ncbi:hypothetical protein Tco_1563104 [Tanacetum coccineum]
MLQLSQRHGNLLKSGKSKGNQRFRRKDSGNNDVLIGLPPTEYEQRRTFLDRLTANLGSDTEVTSCSKECKESYAKLKKLYDEQREQLGDASIEIQAYDQALKKKLLAEAVKEKEELKTKLEGFQNSSKGLKILLNSQMSVKDKVGNIGHMTGNKAYLVEYQDYNGGLVAFGELQHFNLFSVSQMCDKKNKYYAQVEKILHLKSRIKKLEKKFKPSISHHRAWLKSVKSTFDDLDTDGINYMETEDVVNEGRLSKETKELNVTHDTEVLEKGEAMKNLLVLHGIDADALFTAKLQQEEREEYTNEERSKVLAETIAAQENSELHKDLADIE